MKKFLLGLLVGALTVGGYFVSQSYQSPPPSALASPESTAAAKAMMERLTPHLSIFVTGDVAEQPAMLDEHLYQPFIDEARQLYAVHEEALEIDGVYTEIFTPPLRYSP